MNENAKAWVKALRSGDYQQTRHALRRDNGFCCLGVACDLAVKAGLPVELRESCGMVTYNGEKSGLPPIVRAWLGLSEVDGYMEGFACGCYSLAYMNDHGGSFTEIADAIEEEPLGLFVR